MFADHTLTPKEATRLCALGTLAQRPTSYGALAQAIRHFQERVMGPSLDVLGQSIQLLKYEGLVESAGDGDDAPLSVTAEGKAELETLLTANVRADGGEVTRLVVALKFRFLHLLDEARQREQIDLLAHLTETELTRLVDLRQHHAGEPGHLVHWLDSEVEATEARLAWLEDFRGRI